MKVTIPKTQSGQIRRVGQTFERLLDQVGSSSMVAGRQVVWGSLMKVERGVNAVRFQGVKPADCGSPLAALLLQSAEVFSFGVRALEPVARGYGFGDYLPRFGWLHPDITRPEPRFLNVGEQAGTVGRRAFYRGLQITRHTVPGYECVLRARGPQGFASMIGVHDVTLGPALGGLRMWDFVTEAAAKTDVLRLSRGMTYKSACADDGLGGGKAVLLGDVKTQKSPAWLTQMGRFVDYLGGLYYTAEDVNIGTADLVTVREETPFVTGLPLEMKSSGNPSPYTALGVIEGLRAVCLYLFKHDDLGKLRFAIQGAGAVGADIAEQLLARGAAIFISDINSGRLDRFRDRAGVTIVESEQIYDCEADVFVPCGLGGILNQNTIPRLKVKAVAGCANNQLKDEVADMKRLEAAGILYATDFVLNAGGVINVSLELEPGGYNAARAREKVMNIGRALDRVFRIAEKERVSTVVAAMRLAEQRMQEARAAVPKFV